MKRIIVMRHGESEADLLDVHEGRADFPLTVHGEKQAQAAAVFLNASYKIGKIWCSPLKRAYRTAEILSEETDAALIVSDYLMEFNNGLIAGMSRKEAAELYPEIPDLPLHKAEYSQESVLQFRYRAEFMLSEIISSAAEDETAAVVTHGGMINQLYRAFFRLPPDDASFFFSGDTGIHEWRIKDGARCLVYANRTEHLKKL